MEKNNTIVINYDKILAEQKVSIYFNTTNYLEKYKKQKSLELKKKYESCDSFLKKYLIKIHWKQRIRKNLKIDEYVF
jgi:hypothetical protein